MFLKQTGVLIGWLLMAAGDVMPKMSPWAQLGAAGVLAAILIYVIKDNATDRKERADERSDERAVLGAIHDRLHADSEKLNQTLRELVSHCEKMHKQNFD